MYASLVNISRFFSQLSSISIQVPHTSQSENIQTTLRDLDPLAPSSDGRKAANCATSTEEPQRQAPSRLFSRSSRSQMTPCVSNPITLPGRRALAHERASIAHHLQGTAGEQNQSYPLEEVRSALSTRPSDLSCSQTDVSSSYSSFELHTQTVKKQSEEICGNAEKILPRHKHTMGRKIIIGLKAMYNFVLTPFGILVTVYALNVVAWGGMVFLLTCNAAPAMCDPTCDDMDSPREEWIEIGSRCMVILLGIMVFGLSPWRLRDLYYLLQYRILKKQEGLRRLAGIHGAWFRLSGSDCKASRQTPGINLFANDSSVPIPVSKAPGLPATGFYVPPTKTWKLDFVIWMFLANIVFQAVLIGVMYGFNRFNRPSWCSGVFVSLTLGAAACAGMMAYIEIKRVRSVEGRPFTEEERVYVGETVLAPGTTWKDAWRFEHYLRLWGKEKGNWGFVKS